VTHTLPPFARDILNRLLDQHEQPNRQRVSRVRLKDDEDYAHGSRADIHAALAQLAAQGIIELHWRKWEENNWLDAVDLRPEQAGAAYELLGRLPHLDRVERLRVMIAAQSPQAVWHTAFLCQTLANLDAHRSVTPLDLDDPAMSAELLTALAALDAQARLCAPVLERVFSVQVFHDSKRFEALRPKVLTILRRHDPAAESFGDDDKALLREHYLDRAPEYVPISGALRLEVGGATVDLAPFVPSVALPASLLHGAAIRGCTACELVTVENLTSFTALAARRPAGWLLIYTGGFASPGVIDLIGHIRAAAPDIRLRHWGDLDAGGLRILAHLRAHLGAVEPVAMDCATLTAYSAYSQPLTTEDRRALRRLRESAALADCLALIDMLLEGGRKLEQEAVQLLALL